LRSFCIFSEVNFIFFGMEIEGFDLNNGKKIGDGFVDRSKVRILLCDTDSNTSQEVFTLLLRCCYQGMYE